MQDITAIILTYNEKENIQRTLQSLNWVKQVLLIDSYSSDETLSLAFVIRPDVSVRRHEFRSFADQCNWALSQVDSEWVLSLDADYLVTPELAREIEALPPDSEVDGYRVRFKYCINGRPLRSSILPPRTMLYRRSKAKYHNDGHGHRVAVRGRVINLAGFILHDDRKPLSRWLQEQDKYTRIEAPHLLNISDRDLSAQDRLRKKVFFAAPIVFLYLLLGRGLIFDHWYGWYYVMQRTLAEMMLSLRILSIRYRLEADSTGGDQTPAVLETATPD